MLNVLDNSVYVSGLTGYGYGLLSTTQAVTGSFGDRFNYYMPISKDLKIISLNANPCYVDFYPGRLILCAIQSSSSPWFVFFDKSTNLPPSISTAPVTIRQNRTGEYNKEDYVSALSGSLTTGYWDSILTVSTSITSATLSNRVQFWNIKRTDREDTAHLIHQYLAENLQPRNYTPESWNAYISALDRASYCYRAPQVATEVYTYAAGNILDSYDALITARNALELLSAEYSALDAALALIPEHSQAMYTEESWAAYSDAMSVGQNIEGGLAIEMQTEITNAAIAIHVAFKALTLKPADFDNLGYALFFYGEVNLNLDQSNYTEESVNRFREALRYAEIIYFNPYKYTILDQQIVDNALQKLDDAYDSLTEKSFAPADYSVLDIALALTPEFDDEKHTVETISTFRNAKAAGQIDRNLTVLDQHIIDSAADTITEAHSALEFKTDVPEGSTAVIDRKRNVVYGVNAGADGLSEFIACRGGEIEVTPYSGTKIGTGTLIELIHNGVVIDSYTLVIFGDVSGDGLLTSIDYALLQQVSAGTIPPSELINLASDLNGDGIFNSMDISILGQVMSQTYELDQTRIR